jgi:hypothetical protein
MKRSFESGYAKRKKAKEQEERIKRLPKLITFFSKATTDITSTSTSTSRLVSSIAEEKEEWSIYAETCSETKGEGATSDTGIPSYLSVMICEECIELMGSKVLAAIVTEVQKAEYFSLSVDSTPDVTRINQLTFIL